MITSPRIRVALVIATLINMVAISIHLKLSHELHEYGRGVKVPIASGVTLLGEKWQADPSVRCHVVRMTSDDCQYCEQDEAAYEEIRVIAKQSQCQVIEVSPIAGKLAPNLRDGVIQLKYVNEDLGVVVEPFITPHTMVLGPGGTLVWMHRGVMGRSAIKDGGKAIRSVGLLDSG